MARTGLRPFSGQHSQPQRPSWFTWWRWGVSPGSKVDYERQAGPPWQNPIITACLGWMSDRAGQAELQVYRIEPDGTEAPEYRHPLLRLLANPNAHYTGRSLIGATIAAYVIDGNAYWVKVRSSANNVMELWYVPPWRVTPRWPEDGSEFVSHYEITIDGQSYAFAREDVVHFRDGIDPYNDRLGLGRVKSAFREICTLNEASQYMYTLLRNMGLPGVIFSPASEADEIGKETAERLKQLALERTGDGRFEPLIVPTGRIRVDTLGFAPKDLSLETLPLRDEAILASVIGIPAQVVGLPSGDRSKTYANQAEAVRSAWGRLQSILESIAQDLTQDLLPDFQPEMGEVGQQNWVVRWSYERVSELQDDYDSRINRAIKLFGTPNAPGLATRNECREMVGLDALPSHLGDILADGTPLVAGATASQAEQDINTSEGADA